MSVAAAALALLLAATPDTVATRRMAVERQNAGQAFMSLERFEDAVSEFKQAIALDPLLVLAHYNLGQSYMALKRYPEAVTAYEGARDAILRISRLGEKERGERERAARDEKNEIRTTINALESGHIKSAQPQQQIMKLEERIRVLESMEGRDRDQVVRVPAELDLALGSAYFRQEKLAEAERAYTAAVKANAKLGAAHNNLAVIYMMTGRYKDAHAAIVAAESAGFSVPPQLKTDLAKREASAQ